MSALALLLLGPLPGPSQWFLWSALGVIVVGGATVGIRLWRRHGRPRWWQEGDPGQDEGMRQAALKSKRRHDWQ